MSDTLEESVLSGILKWLSVLGIPVSAVLALLWRLLVKTPQLHGSWDITLTYENTKYRPYRSLQVTYRVSLRQAGLELEGPGEKISECGPTQKTKRYYGGERIQIYAKGNVTRKAYLGRRAKAHLNYTEKGDLRKSYTELWLECSRDSMAGCFRSSIADTTGPVSCCRLKETK